ncbi:hypothetical protein AGMMS4956_06690 [Bacteroidia bacterium]|nr:hypothetical protein AGMMS4956_06690 [Bacteroidia bacterium]
MRKILLFCCYLFFSAIGQAQNYPITVTTTLLPPYSLRLADYVAPGSQRLMIQLAVNDLNVVNLPVKLHIKMESVGVTIETPVTIAVIPIYLNGGQVNFLFGDDLTDYFNINNLQFKGYSKDTYRRTGQLPDGFWRISVDVLHFGTGRVISNTGTASAWMATGKPPQLKSPANAADMGQYPGMPLVFSWLPVNTGVPMLGGNVQYTFEMWEMRIAGIDPYVATAVMPLFYSSTQTGLTSHIVQAAALMLEPGMTYAWRVTAADPAGFIPFENNGHSEVRTFSYQSKCDTVSNFVASTQLRRGTFQWQPAANHSSFNLEVLDPGRTLPRSSLSYDNKIVYNDLDYGSVYQMRVQGVCNADPTNVSDWTGWRTIRIAERKKDENACPECECKDPSDVMPEITNWTLRKDLRAGDTIIDRRGTTRFIVKSVTPQGDGVYKGIFLFWAEIWNLKIVCEYWDLSVNTDNVIVKMAYESVYDPTFTMDVDKTKEKIDKLADAVATLVSTENVDVIVEFEIADEKSFSIDMLGNVVVTDTKGVQHIVVENTNATQSDNLATSTELQELEEEAGIATNQFNTHNASETELKNAEDKGVMEDTTITNDNHNEIHLNEDGSWWISQYDNMFPNSCCAIQDVCCKCACDEILNRKDVSTDRKQQVIAASSAATDCSNISATNKFNEVIQIIDTSLFSHQKPIMVGVHHPTAIKDDKKKIIGWKETCSGNTPSITNHYVVIIGKKYDKTKKQYYYLFYEVGTSVIGGTSLENRLYIDNNIIKGKTKYKDEYIEYYYILTEVRKNIGQIY